MAQMTIRILGLDPGLQRTGWGIIDVTGNRLAFVAAGTVTSAAADELAQRLVHLFDGLGDVVATWKPDEAAVEETFVNANPTSTLKLGQARAISLLVPSRAGIPVSEYTPNAVKKSVVGAGHAEKSQVLHMVKILLPKAEFDGPDSVDALAVAICHAHHRTVTRALAQRLARTS